MNKTKIITSATILIIIIIAVLAIVVYYNPQVLEKLKISKLSTPKTTKIPGEDLSPLLKDIGPAEKEKFSGKADVEIKAEFEKEKQACLTRLADSTIEELIKVDSYQAISLATCQAFKDKNSDTCNMLKDNEKGIQDCKETSNFYLKVVFPMFKNKSCGSNIIKACQETGDKNCNSYCDAFVLNKVEACGSMESPLKEVCTAVLAGEPIPLLCQTLKDNRTRLQCESTYYLWRAIKENQVSYLDNIKDFFILEKLYFNPNLSCQELMATSFNEDHCSSVYSEEALSQRLDIAEKLRQAKATEN